MGGVDHNSAVLEVDCVEVDISEIFKIFLLPTTSKNPERVLQPTVSLFLSAI